MSKLTSLERKLDVFLKDIERIQAAEMKNELTPEDLRKAIEQADAETEEYGAGNPDYGDVDVDVCRAALSAWKADIARREKLGRALAEIHRIMLPLGLKSRIYEIADEALGGEDTE